MNTRALAEIFYAHCCDMDYRDYAETYAEDINTIENIIREVLEK